MPPSTIAYLFPGQGAQYAGIGADLYAAQAGVREVYAQASEALGYDIAELSFGGDAERINLTRYTQPVLLTHSMACMRVWHERVGAHTPVIAAGHSLGEYCALVASGALAFADALRLVKTRGELMGEYGRGAMAALMLTQDDAGALAQRHYCQIAACNLPEQTVIGGREEDVAALLEAMAQRHPRKRGIRLKTEGAFHTYLMVEAAMKFRETLARTSFAAPKFAVLSNFSGDAHDDDVDAIRSRLFLQLFNPVLWCDNLTAAATRAECLIEFGGGLGKGDSPADKRPNLEGIVKKTCTDKRYLAVINVDSLEASATAFLDG